MPGPPAERPGIDIGHGDQEFFARKHRHLGDLRAERAGSPEVVLDVSRNRRADERDDVHVHVRERRPEFAHDERAVTT